MSTRETLFYYILSAFPPLIRVFCVPMLFIGIKGAGGLIMDQTKSDTNILRGGYLLSQPAKSINESLFIGTEGFFVHAKKLANI